MITSDDILDALTKAAAYDTQHTPKTSSMLVAAWLEHFGRYAPDADRDDLLAAVTEYHREPHDRMLQAADLSAIARAIRHRDDDGDPLEPPPRPTAEPADYPPDWTADQRLTAYWHALRSGALPSTETGWTTVLDHATRTRHDHSA